MPQCRGLPGREERREGEKGEGEGENEFVERNLKGCLSNHSVELHASGFIFGNSELRKQELRHLMSVPAGLWRVIQEFPPSI